LPLCSAAGKPAPKVSSTNVVMADRNLAMPSLREIDAAAFGTDGADALRETPRCSWQGEGAR
jgi:hypothetical protein